MKGPDSELGLPQSGIFDTLHGPLTGSFVGGGRGWKRGVEHLLKRPGPHRAWPELRPMRESDVFLCPGLMQRLPRRKHCLQLSSLRDQVTGSYPEIVWRAEHVSTQGWNRSPAGTTYSHSLQQRMIRTCSTTGASSGHLRLKVRHMETGLARLCRAVIGHKNTPILVDGLFVATVI